jgi:hypothetical protein
MSGDILRPVGVIKVLNCYGAVTNRMFDTVLLAAGVNPKTSGVSPSAHY